jgi:hypothetical protein
MLTSASPVRCGRSGGASYGVFDNSPIETALTLGSTPAFRQALFIPWRVGAEESDAAN